MSLSLDIEDLSHVLSLRIAENDRSHSHVVTGSVREIFSIHWMLGKKDICVVFRVSNADSAVQLRGGCGNSSVLNCQVMFVWLPGAREYRVTNFFFLSKHRLCVTLRDA